MSDENLTKSAEPLNPKSGSRTSIIMKTLDMISDDRENDADVAKVALKSKDATIKRQSHLIMFLAGALILIVVMITGVGFTGKIPGVGEVSIDPATSTAPAE